MRICDAFCGVAVAAALGFAGQALAFDVKNINPETPPAEAFKYGLDAYKSGDKPTARGGAQLRRRKGPSGRPVEARPHVCRGRRRQAGRLQGVRAVQRDRRRPRRGQPQRALRPFRLQRLRRARRLLPEGHPQPGQGRTRPARASSTATPPPTTATTRRSSTSPACTTTARAAIAIRCRRRAGPSLPPTRAMSRAQALLGHLLFEGDEGLARQPVLGLMYLSVARDRAKKSDGWIFQMQEEAVSRRDRIRTAHGHGARRRLDEAEPQEEVAAASGDSLPGFREPAVRSSRLVAAGRVG